MCVCECVHTRRAFTASLVQLLMTFARGFHVRIAAPSSERKISPLLTAYHLHVHLTYLRYQEGKTASTNITPHFLQLVGHVWIDMDNICRFIYTSFPLCLNGGICKFLNNSLLCSDVLQPISLPFLIPIRRPHTLMRDSTLPTKILRPA